MVSMCCAVHAAPDQWIEVRSPHFTVLTDSNEKQARHIADQFERMRWMFQTLFPKAEVDPVAPIIVMATKNSKGFQALEPEAYLASGQLKLAGLFLQTSDKNYVLLRLDAEFEHPFASVYHEYTHLQFSADHEWLPLWLNEGLAEFFQNTDIHDKDIWLGQASPDDVLYLRQNSLIPLPVLFKVDARSPYYHEEQKGSVFYAESWALVHYLQFTDRGKGTHRIDDYMGMLSHHEDPVVAAEKAFGNLKALQSALEGYIRESSYHYLVLPSGAAPINEAANIARPLTHTEADAARADFLAYVGRIKDARTMAESVLQADPQSAQAHETMGVLETRDGHIDEARKWYGEAVKLKSTNYLAYYNFAGMSMGSAGPDTYPELEANLRIAMQLNPRFYPACDLLASILMSENRDEDAVGVLKAWAAAAGNPYEASKAIRREKQIERVVATRDSVRAEPPPSSDPSSTVVDIVPESGPKHPNAPTNGTKHEILGAIHRVTCSYPAVIEFSVEGPKQTVALYNNDYYKLEFSTLGFTPSGPLNPCGGIEGLKARVQYVESPDKTVDGQVVSVELRK